MNAPDIDRAEAVSDVERCPECRELMVPIACGYPGAEMFEAAERGEIVLGGCTIDAGNPTRRCPCGAATSGSLPIDELVGFDVDEVINRARLDDTWQ
ncbi:hypothetical protein N9Q18_01280 [bacterium]|jgi:hypothetical protein|nr:hypothetical protein [bacterium]